MTLDLKKIRAVVVYYHPPIEVIDRARELACNLDQLIVVSNETDLGILEQIAAIDNVVLIVNTQNMGLAYALNQGIAAALRDGVADYVWLLDQDSRASSDVAKALLIGFMKPAPGRRPGCIGPWLVDDRTLSAMTAKRGSNPLQKVTTIATSGSLISRDALNGAGLMLEGLFIDGIDHEWCFRARAAGFEIFSDRRIPMLHHMGETVTSMFGRTRPMYRSPARHYYIVRNTAFLLGRSYISLEWRLAEAVKLLRRLILYPFYSDHPMSSIRRMTNGLYHGIRGRLGPMPD